MRTYTATEYAREDYENYRNNITIEETIHLLEHISDDWIYDYSFTGTEDDFERYKLHAALYNAIEILQKRGEQ